MSKSYFGLLDSRNTKYQGLIKDNSFNGIGILIDNLFTTIVTTWKKHTLNGHSIIVFPYLEIFFGEMQEDKPQGLVCFQINQKQKLIADYKEGKQNLTIAHISLMEAVTHLQKKSNRDQYTIIGSYYCNSQAEQLKHLTNIFKKSVKKQIIDLKTYIEKYFIQPYQHFQLSGKNQSFFGFKNSTSIGFKFENNTINSIGNYTLFPRHMMFGRKVHRNINLPLKTTIQQGRFSQPIKTFTYSKVSGSPIECQKFTEEYFKKSTTFRNQFTRLGHVDQLCIEMKIIQKGIKQQISKKYGQALLQNNYGSQQIHQAQNQEVLVKEYTLSEVKEEIYKAAARKKDSAIKGSNDRSPIKNQSSFYKNQNSSPYKGSGKRHVQSLYFDPVFSSRRTHYEQNYKVSQFGLNILNLEQQIPHKVLQAQIFQKPLNYERKYYDKPGLLKQVDQRLKAQKQYERALIKQLIKQQELKSEVLLRQQQFLKGNNYNQQILTSQRKKYRRYDQKVSPFKIQDASFQNLKSKRKSLKKTYNCTGTQRQNTKTIIQQAQLNSKRDISPYDRLKNDKSVYDAFNRRNNTSPLVTNSPDMISHENTNITHDHLAKYKQRKKQRQIKPFNDGRNSNNQINTGRYSYVPQQNQQQNENQVTFKKKDSIRNEKGQRKFKRNHTENLPIQELKLFGQNNYLKKSNAYNFDTSPYKVRQERGNRNLLTDRTNQLSGSPTKQILNPKYSQKERQNSYKNYTKLTDNNPKLNKKYQAEKSYRRERDHTPTKIKRTFHYVEEY